MNTEANRDGPPGNAPGGAVEDVLLDEVLRSRLALIDGLPLEERAAAFAHLHDRLRERLEGPDEPRSANG